MKRKVLSLFLLALLMLGVVSQSALAAPEAQYAIPHLVVNTSFLNVRSGDGPQYTTIATVVGGTELPVLGANNSFTWYLVTTAFGPGWVDVTFTLPRGDFSNVPVVNAQEVAPVVAYSTPLTIGLIGTTTAFSATAQTVVPTGARVEVNVISVNLRTQPGDSAPVITTLFKGWYPDYALAGTSYDDRGVAWVAIVVPGIGTGWIEAAKTSASTVTSTTTTTNAVPVPVVGGARVVVNTSYQNVRLGAGPQYAVLAVVPGGTTLSVAGVTGDTTWYLVDGDFGRGWIASEFVLFRGDFSSVPILYSPY